MEWRAALRIICSVSMSAIGVHGLWRRLEDVLEVALVLALISLCQKSVAVATTKFKTRCTWSQKAEDSEVVHSSEVSMQVLVQGVRRMCSTHWTTVHNIHQEICITTHPSTNLVTTAYQLSRQRWWLIIIHSTSNPPAKGMGSATKKVMQAFPLISLAVTPSSRPLRSLSGSNHGVTTRWSLRISRTNQVRVAPTMQARVLVASTKSCWPPLCSPSRSTHHPSWPGLLMSKELGQVQSKRNEER